MCHRNFESVGIIWCVRNTRLLWKQKKIKLSPNSVQNESLEQVLLRLKNPSARCDAKAASKLWNRKPIGTTWNYPMSILFDFTYLPNFHHYFLYIAYFSSNPTRIFRPVFPYLTIVDIYQDKCCFGFQTFHYVS